MMVTRLVVSCLAVLGSAGALMAAPTVTDYYPQQGGPGSRITVHVSDLGAMKAPRAPDALRLYLEGRRLTDVRPIVDVQKGRLVFELAITDATRAVWASLPGGSRVTLSVGWEGEGPLPVTAPALHADQPDTIRRFRLEPSVESVVPSRASLGDLVTVRVTGLSNMRAPNGPETLRLFVGDRIIADSRPLEIDLRASTLTYRLAYSEASRDAWRDIRRASTPVPISVGWEPEGRFAVRPHDAGGPAPFMLVADRVRLASSVVLLGLALVAGLYAVTRTNVLRNRQLMGSAPGPQPYAFSLARCQMAWWTLVSVAALLFLWPITGEFAITAQLLVLMGISGATALGAVVVDSAKQSSATQSAATAMSAAAQAQTLATSASVASAQLAGASAVAVSASANQLQAAADAQVARAASLVSAAQPPRASPSVLQDLVNDEGGASLHRLQVLVWTLVLSSYFVTELVTTLRMPPLSTELLALMGISGATYVGFKFPEVRK